MPKQKRNLSRLRRFLTAYKHDIIGISGIMGFFGVLFLAAATGGAGGVANCIRSSNIEKHPMTPIGTLGLVFFAAGFISIIFITAVPSVRRIVHMVPYVIILIGAPFVFIDEAPKLLDPFVGILIVLAVTAVTHACQVYEVRQDAQRRPT
jgi:hypothetical protein